MLFFEIFAKKFCRLNFYAYICKWKDNPSGPGRFSEMIKRARNGLQSLFNQGRKKGLSF